MSGNVECHVVIMECGGVVVGIVVHIAQYAIEQETDIIVSTVSLLLGLFQ